GRRASYRLAEAPGGCGAERKGEQIMKHFAVLLICCVLAGCKRESAYQITGDIRGQPIAGGSTSDAPASANPAAKIQKIGDYHVVGFDKLSAYSFEVSDDLLAPATNNAAMAQRVDSQIPPAVKTFNDKLVAL